MTNHCIPTPTLEGMGACSVESEAEGAGLLEAEAAQLVEVAVQEERVAVQEEQEAVPVPEERVVVQEVVDIQVGSVMEGCTGEGKSANGDAAVNHMVTAMGVEVIIAALAAPLLHKPRPINTNQQ